MKLKHIAHSIQRIVIFSSIVFLSGCATVPLESAEKSHLAKQFLLPKNDMAGIYVYRDNKSLGTALKRNIWINDECIGELAKGVFFYHEVKGDAKYKISTESEFSPNDLFLSTESGNLYFVRQYIKFGVFVGGSDLEIKTTEAGKGVVHTLDMAKKGKCE